MKLVFNVTRFEMQYPRFIKEVATKIVEEEILKPIHQEMKVWNYSQKIIDSTTIENLVVDDEGFVQFEIVSDYESESGFDVSLAREEGTRKHWVAPITKKALSWLAGFVRLFSKGHYVGGIPKSNIIERITEIRVPLAQQRLTNEISEFFDEVVNS